MANYLYNGLELPDINEVWTDKETYPYAYIAVYDYGTRLYLSKTVDFAIVQIDNGFDGGISYGWRLKATGVEIYQLNSLGDGWSLSSSNITYANSSIDMVKWANFDVLSQDGSVYLAASEPIPVGQHIAVYMDIGGERKKVTAYKDIGGVRTLISSADSVVTAPENCLTFSSAEPFTIATANTKKNWNGTLYYSVDGATWSEWDGTTAIASDEHCDEQRIYMRGVENTGLAAPMSNYSWVLTGNNILCIGNIECLLDYETVTRGEHPTMKAYCFSYLFYGCSSLVTAPELPATTLTDSCYRNMFQNCTSLTIAPELPATTLANTCYIEMFKGCTSLTIAPELPATALVAQCYQYMFQNCTSLTIAPKLPATTLARRCYSHMFKGCTSLITAPELPATNLEESCYQYMFQNCTSLTTAPTLPATNLADYCYNYMFVGCESLITIPSLPAITLAIYCYAYMFSGCSNIKMSKNSSSTYANKYRIPTSGTGTTATLALEAMFENTGGYTGTPSINTTYYTANAVV